MVVLHFLIVIIFISCLEACSSPHGNWYALGLVGGGGSVWNRGHHVATEPPVIVAGPSVEGLCCEWKTLCHHPPDLWGRVQPTSSPHWPPLSCSSHRWLTVHMQTWAHPQRMVRTDPGPVVPWEATCRPLFGSSPRLTASVPPPPHNNARNTHWSGILMGATAPAVLLRHLSPIQRPHNDSLKEPVGSTSAVQDCYAHVQIMVKPLYLGFR